MLLAKVSALILGAGQGKRMGGRVSKQFLEVEDRPLLAYTLDKFQGHALIEEIIVVTQEEDIDYCWQKIIYRYNFTKVNKIVSGGKERQDSVYQGLLALPDDTEWVVIHDGVRPLISMSVITNALTKAQEKGAAIVGVPAKDTIKVVQPNLMVEETPKRETLWQVQTPQVFKKELIVKAYRQAVKLGWQGTDDASLVEKLGVPVFVVRGDYNNLKITTPEDLVYFKEILRLNRRS
jgi:2-C-methyl-D-erythritol 4-phosphate cytidylyltransferase